ncbi:TRAP transporter large permease subunit [Chloroflexota bacterium]
MEWWVAGISIFSVFLVLLLMGLPVAFVFMAINVAGVFLFWGGTIGLQQLIFSIWSSVSTFSLLPVPLFVLMGEVMFLSGIAPLMIDSMDKWLGRLPGRLALLALGGGTAFSFMSGSSISSVAMLGSVLVPDMEKRGYSKSMSIGPILGSGLLAGMIPPASLAVFLAAIAQISVGRLLMAIIIPGLIMATLYAPYIIIRCWLDPSLAPSYKPTPTPLVEKLISTVRHILPLGGIVFLVIGVIFIGMATPSEAAALGALGCFVLAALYGKMNWEMLKKSVSGTLRVSGMIFLIFTGAIAYSQILAFTGVTSNLVGLATGLPVHPMVILIAMQFLVLIMGMFMDASSILMVCLPIYMPIVYALGFDPIWFGVVMLINVEIGLISPPFGFCLFTMKGVAPADSTMGDIYRAAIPYCILDVLLMGLVIAFPILALWLPGLMMK